MLLTAALFGTSSPISSHCPLEEFPVLGLVDRMDLCADQLDVVFVEYPFFRKLDSKVQRSLASHRRQERIRPLLFDDQFRGPPR